MIGVVKFHMIDKFTLSERHTNNKIKHIITVYDSEYKDHVENQIKSEGETIVCNGNIHPKEEIILKNIHTHDNIDTFIFYIPKNRILDVGTYKITDKYNIIKYDCTTRDDK